MAAHAFGILTFHVTVDAFLLEAPFILRMQTQPEPIAADVMQDIVVVAVPAGVTGKIGSRIVRYRVTAGGGEAAVTAEAPFCQVDLGGGVVIEGFGKYVLVLVRPVGAMTVQACHGAVDRAAPDRVGSVLVAFGI